MRNLSIGKLRKSIRKLERKISGEKSAGGKFFDVFKKKITSPAAIVIAVVSSAAIGWFSFKKITKKHALKATHKPSSSRRNIGPILVKYCDNIVDFGKRSWITFWFKEIKIRIP